ncbi:MAG: CinA family nicotinamide mononucleotide deamidase-related protein [Planctomycetia bacterium]|nr:CinA family nicotinamide mononucleotide deamidase-related protein [Planctomycetia bacterium]
MTESQRHLTGEIISIGDEITNGSILDTNSQWLSRELAELGVRVLFHDTVGDDLAAMTDVFRTAAARSDVVIISGGLGPTEDDLTRQAVAQAFGRELVQDAASLEHVRNHFARRHRVMPESNLIQSYFPKGATVIFNPNGTAPGFQLELDRKEFAGTGSCCLMTFPGVPAELKEMWFHSAKASLAQFAERSGLVRHYIRMKKFLCFGAGESEVESRLGHLIRRDHIPTVGITASEGIISLRILAEGESEEECIRQIEETSEYIRARVGELIFGEDNESMADVVCRELRTRGLRVGTLEWGTRGLLAARIAPDVFAGGTVESETREITKAALAAACQQSRNEGKVDFLLVVGPYPKTIGHHHSTPCDHSVQGSAEETVTLRLYDVKRDVLYEEEHSFGLHPAILDTLFCTRALDLLRRKLTA